MLLGNQLVDADHHRQETVLLLYGPDGDRTVLGRAKTLAGGLKSSHGINDRGKRMDILTAVINVVIFPALAPLFEGVVRKLCQGAVA